MKKVNNYYKSNINNRNSLHVCRDCKKVLPDGYNRKLCEACLNKRAGLAKKGLKVVGSLALVVAKATPIGKLFPKK